MSGMLRGQRLNYGNILIALILNRIRRGFTAPRTVSVHVLSFLEISKFSTSAARTIVNHILKLTDLDALNENVLLPLPIVNAMYLCRRLLYLDFCGSVYMASESERLKTTSVLQLTDQRQQDGLNVLKEVLDEAHKMVETSLDERSGDWVVGYMYW